MAKKQVMVWAYQCERCGHEWIPRGKLDPKICPACKTPYWDRPRTFPVSESRPRARSRLGRPTARGGGKNCGE